MVAHNAGFDRAVLNACCATTGLAPPRLPFKCTVQMARETWKLYPTKLSNVCTYLQIPLVHHQADSDAEACARIALAAHASRMAGEITSPQPGSAARGPAGR